MAEPSNSFLQSLQKSKLVWPMVAFVVANLCDILLTTWLVLSSFFRLGRLPLAIERQVFQDEHARLGPMRRAEKIDPTNLRVVRLGARIEAKTRRAKNCQSVGFPSRGIGGSMRDIVLCDDEEETEEEFAAALAETAADS